MESEARPAVAGAKTFVKPGRSRARARLDATVQTLAIAAAMTGLRIGEVLALGSTLSSEASEVKWRARGGSNSRPSA